MDLQGPEATPTIDLWIPNVQKTNVKYCPKKIDKTSLNNTLYLQVSHRKNKPILHLNYQSHAPTIPKSIIFENMQFNIYFPKQQGIKNLLESDCQQFLGCICYDRFVKMYFAC